MHSASASPYFVQPRSYDDMGLGSQHAAAEESPHRADTVLWLRKQLSEKDTEIMQASARRPSNPTLSAPLGPCGASQRTIVDGLTRTAFFRQVRHDHLKVVSETRAAKKQWEEVLKQKNEIITHGADRIHR